MLVLEVAFPRREEERQDRQADSGGEGLSLVRSRSETGAENASDLACPGLGADVPGVWCGHAGKIEFIRNEYKEERER